MGTSIGAAIDYLIDKLTNGLTYTDPIYGLRTAPALSTINPVVEVVDNLPVTSSGAWVTIGRSGLDQTDTADGDNVYEVMGRQRITEKYTIPGFVQVTAAGPKQKPTRDKAVALFDGVVKLAWTDPTLGGILNQGRIGFVSRFVLDQPEPDPGNAAMVTVMIPFGLQITNSYIP